MKAQKSRPGPVISDDLKKFDSAFGKELDQVFGAPSRLEPDCNDDAAVSLAISTKRAADALERIAKLLEAQNDIGRAAVAELITGEE